MSYHPTPKMSIVAKEYHAQYGDTTNALIKAYHCNGKKEALLEAVAFQRILEGPYGLVVSFHDGSMHDIIEVLGIYDRGPTTYNQNRYWVMLKCEPN